MLLPIVGAQAGAAGEEALVEILVVDGDGFHQRGGHSAHICNMKHDPLCQGVSSSRRVSVREHAVHARCTRTPHTLSTTHT